jgi:glycosyltransferase involved in cell wall biosynthesis
MKISLVGPIFPFRGGISHSHSLLVVALEQAGHTIQIISFQRQYPKWLYPGQSDKDPSQKPLRLPGDYKLDPLYPWTWVDAVQTIVKFKPDLVIFQWWTVFWAPAFAWIVSSLRHKKLTTLFFIHNVLPHEPRPLDSVLARLALNQANGYITLTDRECERLRKLLPGLKKQISTVSLPIFQFASQTTLTKAAAREFLSLPKDKSILLFFGFIRPYKGLSYLIDALGQLAEHPSHPFLAIAGEFWEDPTGYQNQIDRLGLKNDVRIENRYLPDEEAILWFRAADLFVAPYIGGTQSAALRLALGYGLPVIASDIITHEITNLDTTSLMIVPAGDSSALAKAILNWLENPEITTKTYSSEEEWAGMVKTIEHMRKVLLDQA